MVHGSVWDEGIHYLTLDEQRRLVVQGLLTATLPTKIGGDHNVLVRTMTFEFLRPVFTDDTILYDVKIEQYKKQENYRTAIKASFRCRKGNAVRGFAGIVLSL